MNHVIAKGFQRLFLNKKGLRWHDNGFSDVRASFLPGNPNILTTNNACEVKASAPNK
jgi:hypothetical protein